ncbi:MAG: ATP-binding cassette domain-containing protein [Ignavibacteriales bacterium]|nr:ATP-binding cassette domain-containing protein [Ignavibacteriales bacterium]
MNSLKISNLTFSLDDEKIIKDFSYEFVENSITGILAPVEERMSFLLKILSGIVQPQTGTVKIYGIDLFHDKEKRIQEVRKRIGFCFDRGGLISNLSIRENLLLPLDFHFPNLSPSQKIDSIMMVFGKLDIHEGLLSERPAQLHSQMFKMILLARTFILGPNIILYDNPFLDLELHYRKLVYAYIKSLRDGNGTVQIFISTSDILFEIADTILVFNHGSLVETGNWEKLLLDGKATTQRLIKQYLEAGVNFV